MYVRRALLIHQCRGMMVRVRLRLLCLASISALNMFNLIVLRHKTFLFSHAKLFLLRRLLLLPILIIRLTSRCMVIRTLRLYTRIVVF